MMMIINHIYCLYLKASLTPIKSTLLSGVDETKSVYAQPLVPQTEQARLNLL